MRDRYIYALVDPRSHEICYVGITFNLQVRMQCHYYEWCEKKSPWLDDLTRADLKPEVRIVDMIPCSEDFTQDEQHSTYLLEQQYIDRYLQNGMPLLNRRQRYTGKYRYFDTPAQQENTDSTNGATP